MNEIRRRGWVARIGIALLNLLAPGLGLLRIGQLGRGLATYAIAIAAFLALIIVFSSTEKISFGLYTTAIASFMVVTVACVIVAICWSWRSSQYLTMGRPIWTRWYSIIAAWVLACVIISGLASVSRGLYHNFYAPSEGMEPTILKNDKFVACMRRPADLRRGDVLIVRALGGADYVKRLAGLPGDRIALRNGVVFINGVAAKTSYRGSRMVVYPPYDGPTEARMLLEQFPGERRAHLIQDLGPSPEDNVPETLVAPAHVFLLGDNRDDSADSRVPRSDGGLEQVPMGDVLGRALFFYWPRAKMGQSLRTNP